MPTPRLTDRPEWKSLVSHRDAVRAQTLRSLFHDDPARGGRFVVEAAGLRFDYAKQRVTDETLKLLMALARAAGVTERAEAMFRGDKINITEGRAVLHTALRAPRGQRIVVDGVDVVAEVHAVLDRMADFSARVRSGAWTGRWRCR